VTKILVGILVTAASLWIATLVVPGIHIRASVGSFLIVAVIFGLVNALVRPVAKLLSLPVRILTLGSFIFVINAFMLMLTDWLAGDAMTIDGGFLMQLTRALAASVVVSVASTVIAWIVPGKD
jgi:putative membrane protein